MVEIWRVAVKFRALPWHLRGGTEENHGKLLVRLDDIRDKV